MMYDLPTIESRRAGYERLADLAKATNGLFASRLELDLSKTEFFAANMAAPLGAILARVTGRLNAVEVVRVQPSIERVLRKNRFLANYRYEALEDSSLTTMPFRRLRLSDEGLFEDYVQRQLRGKGMPKMSDALLKVFKKKVFEVYQNAVIHSESALGVFVCGQFYPDKKRLDFTITDAGIGIRDSVRRFLSRQISSIDAIRWALEDGHTTKRGAQPGGLGLKFLHDFIRLNKGQIQIASRFGFYSFSEGQATYAKMSTDLPGTSVTIEMNTEDTAAYCLTSEVTSGSVF